MTICRPRSARSFGPHSALMDHAARRAVARSAVPTRALKWLAAWKVEYMAKATMRAMRNNLVSRASVMDLAKAAQIAARAARLAVAMAKPSVMAGPTMARSLDLSEACAARWAAF